MSYNEAAMEWGWFLHLSVGSHHLCHCDSLLGRHHTHPRACPRKRWGQQSELKQNPVVQLKHVLENQHAARSNIVMSTTFCVWGLKQLYFAGCLVPLWNGEYLFCLLHCTQGLSRAGQLSPRLSIHWLMGVCCSYQGIVRAWQGRMRVLEGCV